MHPFKLVPQQLSSPLIASEIFPPSLAYVVRPALHSGRSASSASNAHGLMLGDFALHMVGSTRETFSAGWIAVVLLVPSISSLGMCGGIHAHQRAVPSWEHLLVDQVGPGH